MNYYMDSEFLEGAQEKRMFGIKYGQTKPTIDLISIALVAEDNREYYAISKDFNLKEAWNRFDLKVEKMYGDARNIFPDGRKYKEYWIRENVLKPIFEELVNKWALEEEKANKISCTTGYNPPIKFTYKNFRKLINKYGKTNKQIAEGIKDFISEKQRLDTGIIDQYGFTYNALKTFEGRMKCVEVNWGLPQFYGYFADYDWVCFAWLFGKMSDLPKGLPMMVLDIQQQIEDYKIDKNKLLIEIPQTGCHNSLNDALWNKKAYNWIQNEIKNRNSR